MDSDKLEELLLIISDKDNNIIAAETAFTLLYKEYSKFLFAVIRRNDPDNDTIQSVASNTFLKIYENPLAFQIPNDATSKSDRPFKAWIAKIAKNELITLINSSYKHTSSISLTDNLPETAFLDYNIDDIEHTHINTKILQGALDSLNPRDKDILLTLYLYDEEGKKTPRDVLEKICAIHQTTRENVRQVKARSVQKIVEYFKQHPQLNK